MKNRNKKILFFYDLIIFIIIFFLLDTVSGMIMKKLFYLPKAGKHYWVTYTMDKANEDIVIFGSSHANRNYNPIVIGNVFNLSCLNAGAPGQGIVFVGAVQNELVKRYKPKVIILNLDFDFLYASEKKSDRLMELMPYVESHNDIKQLIINRSMTEEFKILSKSYIYNSTLINIFRNLVAPKNDLNGFNPLFNMIRKENTYKEEHKFDEIDIQYENEQIDYECVSAYRSFIESSLKNGVILYLVVSPMYYVTSFEKDRSFMMMKNIAKEYGLEILNYSRSPLFNGKNELFNDTDHLNYNGAELFSQEVANKIKNDIESNTSTTNQEK